jgi:hypothetical protein
MSTDTSTDGRFCWKNFCIRKPWVPPVLVGLLFVGVIVWAINTLENGLKRYVAQHLETVLNADVAALDIWIGAQLSTVESLAQQDAVRDLAMEAIAGLPDRVPEPREFEATGAIKKLQTILGPSTRAMGYIGFVLTSRGGVTLSVTPEQLLIWEIPTEHAASIQRVQSGENMIGLPFKPTLGIFEGGSPAPLMYVSTPLAGADGTIVAAFSAMIRPDDDFTRIFMIGRPGDSGESYAFNREGLLISRSRFEDQLRDFGLLEAGQDSILNIEIRDPGGDLTQGFVPAEANRKALGLTHMAASATSGESGVDVEGYRDYRGVKVVGAWKWLPDYAFGVTTEIDYAEAYKPLSFLRRTVGVLFSLLGVSAASFFAFSYLTVGLVGKVRTAERKARQLGQYALGDLIGGGGFGEVYSACHEMLRRPTAVKILKAEKAGEQSIHRFEREVQQTCLLTHPNTIRIYDYGRTPEGVFYYAMEYVKGVTLAQLVSGHGALPEARAIHILKQVCESLREAHDAGLVHRDVKPENIMVCVMGGIPDFVKVLDFGLVKHVKRPELVDVTQHGEVAGSPRYLSPEAIRNVRDVDARTDIYSLGATAYYLVTGQAVFEGESTMELLVQHLEKDPEPPSVRTDQPLTAELESLILACMHKDAGKRPQTIREVLAALRAVQPSVEWSECQAHDWWQEQAPDLSVRSSPCSEEPQP